MPLYDCGAPECDECQREFGPDRSAAIANFNAREDKLASLYAGELTSVTALADLLDVAEGRNPHVADPFRSILNTALAVREEPTPSEPSGMFRDHSCWKCQDGKKPCVRGAPHQCEYPHARND